MASSEFAALCANIDQLKNHFLNFKKRDDGDYSDAERMSCRAFIAFAHAEFECYLESLSLRIIDEAIGSWQASKHVGIVVVAVLAFRRRESTAVPEHPKEPGKNTLATILMEAFSFQKNIINRNNGIKPKNFADIYTPLGVTEADVEEALLIQLGNSGAHRGDMVHSSAEVSLRKIRDPYLDELKDIDFLVAELHKFDERLGVLNFYR